MTVDYGDMEKAVRQSLGVSMACCSWAETDGEGRVETKGRRFFKELRAQLGNTFTVYVETNHPDFTSKGGVPGQGAGQVFRFKTLKPAVDFYNDCDAHLKVRAPKVLSWNNVQTVRGRG